MYQPGMDRQLAQVYFNDMLQEAAAERAQRQAATAGSIQPAVRALPLLLAAAVPLTAVMIWALIIH